MKTKSLFTAVVLAAALFATGAIAQTNNPTPAPAAPLAVAVTPTPNEIIYLPRLPEPAELTNAAAAQGITVQQIAQSSVQVMVVYRYADGQTHTVAYQLLPVAGSAPATTGVPAVPGTPSTVVYAAPAAVYTEPPYYYYDPFYYPWPWFGPVSFRVGFGYSFHHFGGGYGFRHFGGGYGFHHR
ncbi:MAG TPA: hypothetical protein VLW52_11305 [Opitutaceae bacterium]|nr:hypothetical protein [Opitutaceae bacterium]